MRAQWEGQVKTPKKSKQARRHSRPVEHRGMDKSGHGKKVSADALTFWRAEGDKADTKIEQLNQHSRTVECRGEGKSEHQEKRSELGALTFYRTTRREGLVKVLKESERARGTHKLLSTERGTSQDTEESEEVRVTHTLESGGGVTGQGTKRRRGIEGHSQAGVRISKDNSGYRK